MVNPLASLDRVSAREVPAGICEGCVKGTWVRKREIDVVAGAKHCKVVSAQCCLLQNGWSER